MQEGSKRSRMKSGNKRANKTNKRISEEVDRTRKKEKKRTTTGNEVTDKELVSQMYQREAATLADGITWPRPPYHTPGTE